MEHVKKIHKEGERGFEEEFKVNEIKYDYNKPMLNYSHTD